MNGGRTRVAIVGAGIVGATFAYRLAEAGASVTIVDCGAPGRATSANSFAAVSGTGELDAAEARPMWRRLIAETRELADDVGDHWLHLDGSLWWSEDPDASVWIETNGTPEQMRAAGYRFDIAAPAAVMRDVEPDLRIPGSVKEVYVFPDEGWMDVPAACAALVRAAQVRHGARVMRGTVRALARAGTRITGLVLEDGTSLAADVVVNAAGPWANEIARLAGVSLPLSRRPGAMLLTAPSRVRLRHMVVSPSPAIRADGDGRLLIHRVSFERGLIDGVPPGLDHAFAVGALDDAMRILPGLHGTRIEAVRYGVRPVPRDEAPIIGLDPDVDGLYHVVMHGGVRRAAVVARYATRDIFGEDLAELRPYRPVRPA